MARDLVPDTLNLEEKASLSIVTLTSLGVKP